MLSDLEKAKQNSVKFFKAVILWLCFTPALIAKNFFILKKFIKKNFSCQEFFYLKKKITFVSSKLVTPSLLTSPPLPPNTICGRHL